MAATGVVIFVSFDALAVFSWFTSSARSFKSNSDSCLANSVLSLDPTFLPSIRLTWNETRIFDQTLHCCWSSFLALNDLTSFRIIADRSHFWMKNLTVCYIGPSKSRAHFFKSSKMLRGKSGSSSLSYSSELSAASQLSHIAQIGGLVQLALPEHLAELAVFILGAIFFIRNS